MVHAYLPLFGFALIAYITVRFLELLKAKQNRTYAATEIAPVGRASCPAAQWRSRSGDRSYRDCSVETENKSHCSEFIGTQVRKSYRSKIVPRTRSETKPKITHHHAGYGNPTLTSVILKGYFKRLAFICQIGSGLPRV